MNQETDGLTILEATLYDSPALAVMNRLLINDEGNGNTMSMPALEERMLDWLQKGFYTGYLFKLGSRIIGYALIDPSDMWMRHFFIRSKYRRQGLGRAAVGLLFERLGAEEISLSCLLQNARGLAFWRSFDHEAYSLKFTIRRPDRRYDAAKSAAHGEGLVIREIQARDYPALLSLWNGELGSPNVTAENIMRHYDRVKSDERYKTFVALLGDEVAGFLSSVASYAVGFESSLLQITGIAVRQDVQHQGIGTRLLAHLEDYARAHGVSRIVLNTGYRRFDSHAFYQRNGYGSGSWCFGKNLEP